MASKKRLRSALLAAGLGIGMVGFGVLDPVPALAAKKKVVKQKANGGDGGKGGNGGDSKCSNKSKTKQKNDDALINVNASQTGQANICRGGDGGEGGDGGDGGVNVND